MVAAISTLELAVLRAALEWHYCEQSYIKTLSLAEPKEHDEWQRWLLHRANVSASKVATQKLLFAAITSLKAAREKQ